MVLVKKQMHRTIKNFLQAEGKLVCLVAPGSI